MRTTETIRGRIGRLCTFAVEANILPDLRWYPRYAEPGYSEPGDGGAILSANWNDRSAWNVATQSRGPVDTRPSRLGNLLERLGCELEWCDEWASCDECNGAVRTQPDSMCWEPSYVWADDCTILCADCAKDGDS